MTGLEQYADEAFARIAEAARVREGPADPMEKAKATVSALLTAAAGIYLAMHGIRGDADMARRIASEAGEAMGRTMAALLEDRRS